MADKRIDEYIRKMESNFRVMQTAKNVINQIDGELVDIIVVGIVRTNKEDLSDAYWSEDLSKAKVIATLQSVVKGIKSGEIKKVKI